uniref:Uncharacterized protein n=1 Tax=Cucumis melo TaxID=3656 RepID=A0A9I9E481_CUCME
MNLSEGLSILTLIFEPPTLYTPKDVLWTRLSGIHESFAFRVLTFISGRTHSWNSNFCPTYPLKVAA